MSFEGARPPGGNIENLQMFYKIGLRDLQLFWAVASPLNTCEADLTAFAFEIIKEANRLGIAVDLSHVSGQAFAQVTAVTRAPIIVSHCGVSAVRSPGSKQRSGTDELSDEIIRAVANDGGMICIHFISGYLGHHHGACATVEDLVDHIDYVRRLVGVDYVGLGPDYFPERKLWWAVDAETMCEMPNVAYEMVRRGYTDSEIEKVLGLISFDSTERCGNPEGAKGSYKNR